MTVFKLKFQLLFIWLDTAKHFDIFYRCDVIHQYPIAYKTYPRRLINQDCLMTDESVRTKRKIECWGCIVPLLSPDI